MHDKPDGVDPDTARRDGPLGMGMPPAVRRRQLLNTVAVVGFMVGLLAGCSQGSEQAEPARQTVSSTQATPALALAQTTVATPRPPSLRLFFNDPLALPRPVDRCAVATCRQLVKIIDGAQRSIEFAVYGMRNQTAILNAVLRAKRRGVVVRGVVDRDAKGRNYYADTDAWVTALGSVRDDKASELRLNAKRGTPGGESDAAPRCPRPPGFAGPLQCLAFDLGNRWLLARHASIDNFVADQEGAGGPNRIMHNKFFVIDRRWVWTGSANVSDSDSGGYSANLVAVINSPVLATAYRREFEQMWRGTFHTEKNASPRTTATVGDARVQVHFSPNGSAMRRAVEPLLERAARRIDVAVFYLTNKFVTADLIAAHRRGVKVRVIINATSAQNGFTKHEVLRAAGISVKVEDWGGKMHMKSAVIDGRWVIAGSMNWTAAGDRTNDENTLVIDSPRLARRYTQFYNRIWTGIPPRWDAPGTRPAPESPDSRTACMDGIDNDFDTFVDATPPQGKTADPGCLQRDPVVPLPPNELAACVPGGYSVVKGGPASTPRRSAECQPAPDQPSGGGSCDSAYPTVCIAPPPPDLECTDIPHRRFRVLPPDPHRLDGNGDGVGCEV